ncbi:hypothetical protein E2P65_06755 [Candidatus Bathyarchaeota archaeon]|jgi:hypothetical protein|nr:hypothetical protein E2P65_06755 [Candidatus Bathyarchaeota archaeon]
MAKGFSKKLSSFTFSLQKTYERILNSKPSLMLVAGVVVAASLFLFAGGIYDLLIQPVVAIVGSSGRIISFYPYGITDQFLSESVIVMVFYALGFLGFLVAYRSTKHAYSPRVAYRYLLVGFALLLISYVLLEQNLLASF